MKITKKWIKKWEPCDEAVEWIEKQDTEDVFELIDRLRKSNIKDKYEWLCWAIPRLFKIKKDRVRFAIYCAELALPIFEKEYPNDKRPRQAIQAAKSWLKNPNKKTSAFVARVASYAAYKATAIVITAAWSAAWATIGAADSAGTVGDGAVGAAWNAADSAIEAVDAAGDKEITYKIINYGVRLLKEQSDDK